MIVPDTNIIVRLLTKDDPAQHEKAERLFLTTSQIWIPITVLLETVWVLSYTYDYRKQNIAEAIMRIAGLPNVELEKAQAVVKALSWLDEGIDFADGLHLAQTNQITGIKQFVTFDKQLIKKGSTLVNFDIQEPS